MRNGKRILALDASTTVVGWCIADGTRYVCSGIKVLPKGDWWDRVTAFSNWLGNMLIGDGSIEIVAYEVATGNRGNMHTNRLLGAVEYAAHRTVRDTSGRRQFATVTASEVRASGVHKEALWMASAIKRAPLDDKHAGDEADAIGVWQAYLIKEAT